MISLCELRGNLLRRPVELGPVDPHAMQNDCKLPRDGDFGLAEAVSLGELGSPSLQPRPFRHASQQHAGRLEPIHTQHGVTALGDSAGPIDLPRGMASGRQSDIGPNTSRSLEARRIIDCRFEAECGDRPDTRHGHEPADLHITTRQLVNLTVEIFDLLLNCLARFEQRPDCSHQFGTIFDQPLGPHGEDIELGAADDETEVLKQTTDLVLEITLDLDQQRPARQQRPDRVAVEILNADLLEPARLHDAGDTSCIIAVAFVYLHLEHRLFGALGAVTATIPSEWLLASIGWRGLFELLVVTTAGAAAVVYLLVPEVPLRAKMPNQRPFAGLKTIYSDPRFWRLAPLAANTIGTAWALQSLWAASWLADVEGLDRAGLVHHLFAMAVALSFGALLLGIAADRLRRRGLDSQMLFGIIAALFIVAQIALISRCGLPSYVSWCAVAIVGAGTTLSYAAVAEYFPKELAGRANAALNVFHIAGAFLLQGLTGIVIQQWPM
jgi:Major Facilitator Superfamily